MAYCVFNEGANIIFVLLCQYVWDINVFYVWRCHLKIFFSFLSQKNKCAAFAIGDIFIVKPQKLLFYSFNKSMKRYKKYDGFLWTVICRRIKWTPILHRVIFDFNFVYLQQRDEKYFDLPSPPPPLLSSLYPMTIHIHMVFYAINLWYDWSACKIWRFGDIKNCFVNV